MFLKFSDGRIKSITTESVFLPDADTEDAQRYRDWIDGGNTPEPCNDVPPPIVVQKTVLVEALIKAGYAEVLDQMLAGSPAEIRQAWYAYQEINLSDERIMAFFKTANIDVNVIFKTK